MGLRETKKQATRQALSDAALRLAVQRGLDNVLVEDIAAAAAVSPRTFNNYFTSKYEAICARAMDRSAVVADALRARPAEEPLWTAVTNAALEPFREQSRTPDATWLAALRLVLDSPALHGEYLRVWANGRDRLAAAIAERMGVDPARDMRPKIMSGAVNAATGVATEHWLRAEPPQPLLPLMRRALGELVELTREDPWN